MSLLLQWDFNITVSTQILLLFYPLWCPGLQCLQRFDYTCIPKTYSRMTETKQTNISKAKDKQTQQQGLVSKTNNIVS